MKKTWIFEKILIFQIFFKFQGDLQERVFELRLQPGSQKASKLLKQFIGKDYMGVRAVARALRANKEDSRKPDFHTFLQYKWAGARFPGAQPRVRPCSARQCILLFI